MKTVEPLCLLLDICAQTSRTKDGRPTRSDLMQATGYSTMVLSSGYAFKRSPETVADIVRGFAELFRLDVARLQRFVGGHKDPALRALLELELRKMRCTGEGPHLESAAGLEGGWFDPLVDEALVIPSLRRCKACALRSKPRVGDSWSANLKRHADKLPAALNQAIAALEAKGRAPNYKGLAEEAQMPLSEVRRTIAKAGLEKERKGRKNFGRYLPEWLVFVGALWQLWGGRPAEAAELLSAPSISAKMGPEGDLPLSPKRGQGKRRSQEVP